MKNNKLSIVYNLYSHTLLLTSRITYQCVTNSNGKIPGGQKNINFLNQIALIYKLVQWVKK